MVTCFKYLFADPVTDGESCLGYIIDDGVFGF